MSPTKSKLALMTETAAKASAVLDAAKGIPEVVDPSAPSSTVSLLIVDESTRQETEHDAARSVADYGFYGIKQSRARTEMFDTILKLRRQHPAAPAVREMLGEDAADLIGQTEAYKAAIAKVWGEAETLLVTKLRREIGTESAKLAASGVIGKLRSNLSNDIRKEIEETARGQKNPAGFLLGHGFARSQQLPKGQILAEGAKVSRDDDGNLKVTVPALPAADGAPVEQSDQATPTQTAEAVAAATAEAALTNPTARVNLAVGEIRSAIADKRLGDIPPAERVALARLLGQVAYEALIAIGESLPEVERHQVAVMVKQVAAVALAKLAPEVAKVAAVK